MFTDDYKRKKLEEAYLKGVKKAQETGLLEELFDGFGAVAGFMIPECDEYKAFKKGYEDYRKGKIKKP